MHTIKIILTNLILIIFGLIIIEFISFKIYCKEYYQEPFNSSIHNFINLANRRYNNDYISDFDFRSPAGLEYNNSKIILLGCSYTHSDNLIYNEAFHTQLANYTKHPVYNLGITGGSIKESLYILKNKELLNYLIPERNNVSYVIFTLIQDQMQRLYTNLYRTSSPIFIPDRNFTSLKYIDSKRTFLRLYFFQLLNKYYANNKSDQEKFKLLSLYLKELDKEIKKNFNQNESVPPKLVLFVYDNLSYYDWEEIQRQGIIIINAKDIVKEDLSNEEYKLEDKLHPNAKAWEVIVPALAKELNL